MTACTYISGRSNTLCGRPAVAKSNDQAGCNRHLGALCMQMLAQVPQIVLTRVGDER